MPIQQQLSKQLLLFKNKKLFYIITAFTQNVKKQNFDVLHFKQSFLVLNTTKTIQQPLSCYVLQCELNPTDSISANENFSLQQFVTNNQQQAGLITKQFLDKINFNKLNNDFNNLNIDQLAKLSLDYADNIQIYQNGKVYIEKQYLNILTNIVEDSLNSNKTNGQFDLSDCIYYTPIRVQYNNEELYYDYQNFLYIPNQNYKFKLYVDDKFILNVNTNLLDGQLSKDIIFHACQHGLVYLKIYDINDNFIKSVNLKKTTQFSFNITDQHFYQDKMTFYSNKHYLQGRNIYHGNSICYNAFANFKYKNNILYNDLKYKIISSYNVEFKNGFWFKKNSYLEIRLFFDSLIYVKKIIPHFSLTNVDYSIIYRSSSDETSVSFVPFSKYQNDCFYCNLLDLKIDYNGNVDCELQDIQIQLYDLQKQDIVKTQRFVFNDKNQIILNKRNIIDGVQINIVNSEDKSEYGKDAILENSVNRNGQIIKYITGYETKNYFQLQNINVKSNSDYIQVKDQQSIGYVRFGIDKDALTGDTGTTTNNFRRIYLQYQIVPKKSTRLFDFKNFSVFNNKKYFPKRLTLDYPLTVSNIVSLQFQHKDRNSVIYRDSQTNKITSYEQKWQCVTNGYIGSYFSINRIFVANDSQINTVNWNNYVYLRIKYGETDLVNVNAIILQRENIFKFIDNLNSNGFQLYLNGINYYLRKSELQQPKVQIYTKEYQSVAWDLVTTSEVNTTSTIKRNIQIAIKDGQDKHVKLYSIILKNYDNSVAPNQFVRLNQLQYNSSSNSYALSSISEFDVTGNDITNKPNNEIKYIENNFYNVMYCINYFYQSQKKGKIFQSDQTYFYKSKYETFNKSNLHIEWKYNQLFQYLILFDRFDNSKGNDILKYKRYFLPFYQYYNVKFPNSQYYYEVNKENGFLQACFEYQFNKSQIVLSINPNIKHILPNNIKYDYYYSYSDDYVNWSQYKYYYPFFAFYAKYVKIKCIIYAKDELYYDYVKDISLNYVDSNIYYLTDKGYFQTSYQKSLQQNTKYMIMIRKLYNQKSFDMTLKLFYIGTFALLTPITYLYIDDKLYEDHALIISGIDNICKLSFVVQQQPIQIHIILYKQNFEKIFKQIYTRQFNLENLDNNFVCSYDCKMDNDANKFSQLYGYKVRYFNKTYQVSQFSHIAKFKFNNIPVTPSNLDVDVY